HPAEPGHDVIDHLDQPIGLDHGKLRQRHGDQRPSHHQDDEQHGTDEFAQADRHWLSIAGTAGRLYGPRRQQPMNLMTAAAPTSQARRRAVRLWLLAVAALVFATLVVGGATRLTESGLSIVEWKPVTGVLPPLNAAAWQAEFDKYKTIPQYRERNLGMSLGEFKTIYWWEWTHRLLARLVGAAFIVPFLWFLWRGWIEPPLRARLWTIFALGAALGAVGWWMVASGLAERVSG